MSQSEGFRERFSTFRPTKTVWFWSTAGAVVATMIVGFTLGGWVTGGTADEMAEAARESARAELAATLCVNEFVSAPGAQSNLDALREASSWERDDVIEDGGWAMLTGNIAIVDGSLDLCADKLMAMESLPEQGSDGGDAATAETMTTDG